MRKELGQPKLGLVLRNPAGASYFQHVAKGVQAEAKARAVDLQVQFSDSTDAQLSAVDTVISSGRQRADRHGPGSVHRPIGRHQGEAGQTSRCWPATTRSRMSKATR